MFYAMFWPVFPYLLWPQEIRIVLTTWGLVVLNLLPLPAYSLDLTEDKIISYKYYSTADVLYQAFTLHD